MTALPLPPPRPILIAPDVVHGAVAQPAAVGLQAAVAPGLLVPARRGTRTASCTS